MISIMDQRSKQAFRTVSFIDPPSRVSVHEIMGTPFLALAFGARSAMCLRTVFQKLESFIATLW